MSAYATSLPGSLPLPFFSFGSGGGGDGGSSTAGSSPQPPSPVVGLGEREKPVVVSAPGANSVPSAPVMPPSPVLSYPASSTAAHTNLPAPGDDSSFGAWMDSSPPSSAPSSSSPSSGTIVAILSASVDPVSLIKSLSGRIRAGGSVRRQDSSRSQPARTAGAAAGGGKHRDHVQKEEKENKEHRWMEGRDFHGHCSPSLCREDDQSEEGDEMSFYDYDDDEVEDENDVDQDDCDVMPDTAPGQCALNKKGERMEENDSAQCIQFELSISFQGRKYTATRAFDRFVQLRNELLNELGYGDGGAGEGADLRRTRRSSSGGKLRGMTVESNNAAAASSASLSSSAANIPPRNSLVSIPELPPVPPPSSDDDLRSAASLGAEAFLGAASRGFGVASRGFAFVQATARTCAPDMERWLRQVVEVVPYSPSLGNFLWEPLATTGGSGDNGADGAADDGTEGRRLPSSTVVEGDAGGRSPAAPTPPSRFPWSQGSRLCVLGSIAELDELDNDDDIDEGEETEDASDDDDEPILFF